MAMTFILFSFFFCCSVVVLFVFNLISKAVRRITVVPGRIWMRGRYGFLKCYESKRNFHFFLFHLKTWITKNCHVKYSAQKNIQFVVFFSFRFRVSFFVSFIEMKFVFLWLWKRFWVFLSFSLSRCFFFHLFTRVRVNNRII